MWACPDGVVLLTVESEPAPVAGRAGLEPEVGPRSGERITGVCIVISVELDRRTSPEGLIMNILEWGIPTA